MLEKLKRAICPTAYFCIPQFTIRTHTKTHTHTQTPDSASFCTLFFAFKSFAFILCDVVVYLLFVVNIMRKIYSFVIKAKALLVVQISISSWHFQFILSDSSILFTIATSICIFYALLFFYKKTIIHSLAAKP